MDDPNPLSYARQQGSSPGARRRRVAGVVGAAVSLAVLAPVAVLLAFYLWALLGRGGGNRHWGEAVFPGLMLLACLYGVGSALLAIRRPPADRPATGDPGDATNEDAAPSDEHRPGPA